jgi:hypothetical protein
MLTVRDRSHDRKPSHAAPWRSTGKHASTPADDLCEQAPKPLAWLDRDANGEYCLAGPAAFSYRNEGKAP